MSRVRGAQQVDGFERSARLWLRAYPVRWRAVRGDELIGVLRDLAAPDATHLPLREGLGLLRAGWVTRWRDGPPLGTRLKYRWLELPIPPRYREWARDDIDGRWFVTRRFLRPLAPILVAIWGGPVALGGPPIDPVPALAVSVAGLLLALRFDLLRPQHDYLRSSAATRNLLPRAGEPTTPGGFGRAWGTRPRLTARVGTILAGTGLALGAVMWTTTALIAPRGLAFADCQPEPGANSCFTIDPGPWDPQEWAAVAALAAMVGLGLAGLAMRRTARLLGDRPAQPARVLVSRAPRVVGALVLLVPLTGWQAWLEATGRWVVLVSPWASAICLLMLPGAFVAARVARRGPSDLALIDLWQIGLHGRAPRVDPWVVAVVRIPLAAAAPTGPDVSTGDGTAIAT